MSLEGPQAGSLVSDGADVKASPHLLQGECQAASIVPKTAPTRQPSQLPRLPRAGSGRQLNAGRAHTPRRLR